MRIGSLLVAAVLVVSYQAFGQDAQEVPYALLKYELERFYYDPCHVSQAKMLIETKGFNPAKEQELVAAIKKLRATKITQTINRVIPYLATLSTSERMYFYIEHAEDCIEENEQLIAEHREEMEEALQILKESTRDTCKFGIDKGYIEEDDATCSKYIE